MAFEIDVKFRTVDELTTTVADNASYCSEKNCSDKPTKFGVIKMNQVSIAVCLCNKHANMIHTVLH